jgi:hypothetical protein
MMKKGLSSSKTRSKRPGFSFLPCLALAGCRQLDLTAVQLAVQPAPRQQLVVPHLADAPPLQGDDLWPSLLHFMSSTKAQSGSQSAFRALDCDPAGAIVIY